MKYDIKIYMLIISYFIFIILIIFIKFDIKYMCWYTDFLFVISIKYDFKYLFPTYFIHSILTQKQDNLTLKINCGLGVHWHPPPPDFFTQFKHV
jgi:hypothetical protein